MSDFVICYDISHPRRLARLYRYLLKHAVPLQYSVFLFNGDDRQLECCMQKAIELIDEKEDRYTVERITHYVVICILFLPLKQLCTDFKWIVTI